MSSLCCVAGCCRLVCALADQSYQQSLAPANPRLHLNLDRNRKATPRAERLLRDLQHRRRLLTLVLAAFDKLQHPPHQRQIDRIPCRRPLRNDLLRRAIPLHISLQNRIEDLIRRQRVRIALPRPQLRRGRLGNRVRRDHLAPPVGIPRQRIHPRRRARPAPQPCPHRVCSSR